MASVTVAVTIVVVLSAAGLFATTTGEHHLDASFVLLLCAFMLFIIQQKIDELWLIQNCLHFPL